MNVAELFASVGYKVDEASIKKYDAALEASKKKTEDIVAKSDALLKRMQDLEAARNREEAQVKEFIRLYDKLIAKKGESQEEKKSATQRALDVISFGPLKPKAETPEEKKKRLAEDWKQTVVAVNAGIELFGRGFDFVRGKINGMLGELKQLGGSSGELLNLSKRTGLSTDALQELGHAASQNGSDLQTLTAGWRSFTNKVDAAAAGSKSAAKAFRDVGVSAKDIKSGKVSLDDALGKVADKFSKMEDGTKKTALAMDLFGGAGQKLIPLLNLGGSEIGRFREEARKLGVVIDKQGLESLAGFDDQSNKLNSSLHALRSQALAAIVPQLSKIVDKLQKWLGENREKAVAVLTQAFGLLAKALEGAAAAAKIAIDVFGFLVENSGPVVFALEAMIAAFIAYKISAIAASVGSVAAAVAAGAAWLAAAWPFVAIGVALAAIINYFPEIADAAKFVAGVVVEFFGLVADTAVAIWEGIKAAISFYVNAYVMAFKALWTALKAAAGAVLTGLKAIFGFYADAVRSLVRGISMLWGKIADGAKAVGHAIADAFRSAFAWIIDKVEWLSKQYDRVKSLVTGKRKSLFDSVGEAVKAESASVMSSSSPKTTTINNTIPINVTSNSADAVAVGKAVKAEFEGMWNGKMREAVG